MSDSNLIYKISLGRTNDGKKGAIIDIIDNSQQDKKPKGSIFIYAGTDGTLGTDDDRIEKKGNVPTLNKNTLKQCIDNIKTANESDFDTNKETDIKAEKITRENMFSLELIDTGEELTKALEGKDQDKLKAKIDTNDTSQLIRMGFNDEEAKNIVAALNSTKVDKGIKDKIITILTSVNINDPNKMTELKKAAAIAYKVTKTDKSSGARLQGFLYNELANFTNSSKETIQQSFIDQLTPENIVELYDGFHYYSDRGYFMSEKEIKDPCHALMDDFNDTPEVLTPAFKKILECIIKRAEKMGIVLSQNTLDIANRNLGALTEESVEDKFAWTAGWAFGELIKEIKKKEAELMQTT